MKSTMSGNCYIAASNIRYIKATNKQQSLWGARFNKLYSCPIIITIHSPVSDTFLRNEMSGNCSNTMSGIRYIKTTNKQQVCEERDVINYGCTQSLIKIWYTTVFIIDFLLSLKLASFLCIVTVLPPRIYSSKDPVGYAPPPRTTM